MIFQIYQQCNSKKLNLGVEGKVLNMTQVLEVLKLPPQRKLNNVHYMIANDRLLTINQKANAVSISYERVTIMKLTRVLLGRGNVF